MSKWSQQIKHFGSVTTELKGNLEEFIKKEQARVDGAIKTAIEEVGPKVVTTAKDLAPVRTGNLRDSIELAISKSGTRGVIKVPADKAPYAPFVHFGTVNKPGRPWMYQASERHSGEFKAAIEKALEQGKE